MQLLSAASECGKELTPGKSCMGEEAGIMAHWEFRSVRQLPVSGPEVITVCVSPSLKSSMINEAMQTQLDRVGPEIGSGQGSPKGRQVLLQY